MRPYGATQAWGVCLIESMVVGSWKPSLTSFETSDLKILMFALTDLWLPRNNASSMSARRRVLLMRERGYLAPLSRLVETSSQNGLLFNKGYKILVGRNSDP